MREVYSSEDLSDIDLTRLVAEVRKAAEMQPDRCFAEGSGCEYTDLDTQEPVCIVGVALCNLGYLIMDADMNNEPIAAILNRVTRWNSAGRETIEWIRYAQQRQDNRKTWAESVAEADRLARPV